MIVVNIGITIVKAWGPYLGKSFYVSGSIKNKLLGLILSKMKHTPRCRAEKLNNKRQPFKQGNAALYLNEPLSM